MTEISSVPSYSTRFEREALRSRDCLISSLRLRGLTPETRFLRSLCGAAIV
jgi:hypothetical protein